jgi:hypothetical protein
MKLPKASKNKWKSNQNQCTKMNSVSKFFPFLDNQLLNNTSKVKRVKTNEMAPFLLLLLLQLLLLLLLLLLRDGWAEVDLLGHEPHVHSLLLPVAQTLPDEVLRLGGDGGSVRELNLGGLQQR